MGSGRGAHPPAGPEGRGRFSPAPAPLAAAPGAGRSCQMLGWRRRRELRRASEERGAAALGRGRGRRWPARPPGPLRAAPAGVRRGTGRPGGGSGTGMHSTRLDSFLGQLRWELVRLQSGVTLKDVCGVHGCHRPERHTGGGPSRVLIQGGWGRSGPDGPDGLRRVSDGWELRWASSNSRPAGRAAGAAEGAGGRGMEKLLLGWNSGASSD